MEKEYILSGIIRIAFIESDNLKENHFQVWILCSKAAWEVKMVTALIVVVLGICFYISIYSYSFQKAKYRGLPDETVKKLNVLNSPIAWLMYSSLIGIIIAVIFWNTFANMFGAITNMGSSSNTDSSPNIDSSLNLDTQN